MSSGQPRHGLEWVEQPLGGVQPRWTVEPELDALERLARRTLDLATDARCRVAFLAQGGFNKIYTVTASSSSASAAGKESYVLRVSLPVDPGHKTLSEVATLSFVRRLSGLVPRVRAYSADTAADREPGFEWILMERMPGEALETAWEAMSWESRQTLVERIVELLARLFEQRFSGIGNLYLKDGAGVQKAQSWDEVSIGPIVSMFFFWGDRLHRSLPRGPFRSSQKWLSARLDLLAGDAASMLAKAADEDDLEDAAALDLVVKRLQALLPRMFPVLSGDMPAEATALHHDDLSWHNILVDRQGTLTAVIDWECVSVLPLWHVCRLPSFLDGPDRHDRPLPEHYFRDEETGAPCTLYSEHLREHEKTRLRGTFWRAMERRSPGWVVEHERAGGKADFELAVSACDGLGRRTVSKWLDRVEAGDEGASLRHMMMK